MKFEYNGRNYVLKFQREYKNVEFRHGGRVETFRSTYPYTRAKLVEIAPLGGRIVLAVGTVGCLPTDKYSNAAGRLYAMKQLSYILRKLKHEKGLIAATWQAYKDRLQVSSEVVDAVSAEIKEAPPAPPIVIPIVKPDAKPPLALPPATLPIQPGETVH